MDGMGMPNNRQAEFGMRASHQLISELLGARLELGTRCLMLEEQIKESDERIADLEKQLMETRQKLSAAEAPAKVGEPVEEPQT